MNQPLTSVRDLEMNFGGVVAVHGVSFELKGENFSALSVPTVPAKQP